MYNIYPDSEICAVVLFRTDLDSWLFFRSLTISLADFKGKIIAVHVDSIVEQTVIPRHLRFDCLVMTQMLPHSKEQFSVTLP